MASSPKSVASAKQPAGEAGQTRSLPAIGRLQTAHGVRGEVKVEVWSDIPDRFGRLKRLLLVSDSREAWFDVQSVREGPKGLLVKLKGIDTPEAAKQWVNATIKATPDAEPLPENTWYTADLLGLPVFDTQGKAVGEVKNVHTSGHDLLEVTTPDGQELLIPFVQDWVPEVDLINRRLIVQPVDDLLA